MDLKEAAETLGVTSEAVRKRVRRGTLASEKHEDGRVLVWVDAGSDSGSDGGYDERVGRGYDELLDEVRDRVRYLEKQLDEEREANRENRRIIAGLVQRVPELEAAREEAPEARESAQTASEEPHSTHAPPMPETPVSEAQHKRSWWRTFFGVE
jgi:hypothetical protein